MERYRLVGVAALGAAAGVSAYAYFAWLWKRTESSPLDARATNAALVSGPGLCEARPVVIAGPGFEELGAQLRKHLGAEEFPEGAGPASLRKWSNGDPWIFYNWKKVIGSKVYFLFDTIDQSRFVDQLALLQALQGFPVPDSEDAATNFKHYVDEGNYTWGRAAEVTVILPWYRWARSERTTKWDKPHGKQDPEGEWNEVPSALYLTRALCSPGSVPPPPGPKDALDGMPLNPLWRPPLNLLFLELHEEKPVSVAVTDLQVTILLSRLIPYFMRKFKASEFYAGPGSTYILFPDSGQYRRSSDLIAQVAPLAGDHVLYIEKKRAAESISQAPKLFFRPNSGEEAARDAKFTADDHILILDDFTNTGSTLFGAVDLLEKQYIDNGSRPTIHIFVAHFPASYEAAMVEKLRKKVHAIPSCRFITTNTIPFAANLLKDDPRFEVLDVSEFIAELVQGKAPFNHAM